jgi:acyl-CoA synthetase (AMP-forming)/AMP-acid ligase II
MAQVIQPSELSSLQSLALVGEAMSPIHVSVWSGKLNLMNAYGPTETSIVAAVKAHMSSDTDPANIGSPIGTAWIVDPNNHHRLVPVGAIGELLIEGPTLAREYLNNEEQTAAVFIKNPKWATEISSGSLSIHRRMYKTGDLVRYVSDESGELLYIGRKDHQAKLRGQRLELGEIEHHLNADCDVLSSVVTMPKIGKCAGKLVAVLSLQDFSPTIRNDNELQLVSSPKAIARLQAAQKRLEERLPGYMIPSSWVILEELPLLSSGKLNRKRVTGYVDSIDDDIYRRIMQADEADNHHQTVVITETEARLRSIWGAVFNMNSDRISVERSFLHLV